MIKIPKELLTIPLSDIMSCESFAVMDVLPVYRYQDGKRTDQMIGTRYQLANPDTFENFDCKVMSTKPVVTKEIIDATDHRMYVTLENATVHPYNISFAKAECTVTADAVKLVTD